MKAFTAVKFLAIIVVVWVAIYGTVQGMYVHIPPSTLFMVKNSSGCFDRISFAKGTTLKWDDPILAGNKLSYAPIPISVEHSFDYVTKGGLLRHTTIKVWATTKGDPTDRAEIWETYGDHFQQTSRKYLQSKLIDLSEKAQMALDGLRHPESAVEQKIFRQRVIVRFGWALPAHNLVFVDARFE